MSRAILPGATIGMLGSGQLGRMFAIAARRLGYRIHVFSPDSDSPTGHVADLEVQANYDDLDAVAEFAQNVEVVSFEFENVHAATIDAVERYAPVHPSGRVLYTAQQRIREKTFLRNAGIPVTPFREIHTQAEIDQVTEEDVPAVLKTAAWGYDGKGQVKVETLNELQAAWDEIDNAEAVLERFVSFDCELSVVAARTHDGSMAFYGPMENRHHNHILDVSVTPLDISPAIAEEAKEIARTILTELEVVGVLCVEFFLTTEGKLLVNELAPRPHNSGHLTVDAHLSCQFEQQVRTVCGLPLGSAEQKRPAAMVNLLGDLWQDGEPSWRNALAEPNLKMHLYGKREARVGRKMGHMTVLADTPQEAVERALAARQSLTNRG